MNLFASRLYFFQTQVFLFTTVLSRRAGRLIDAGRAIRDKGYQGQALLASKLAVGRLVYALSIRESREEGVRETKRITVDHNGDKERLR
jgi:hypothetical protein